MKQSYCPESGTEAPVLWSKPYFLTVLGTLFIFIPYALFLPVLPVYVVEKLNGSLTYAGAVNAAFLFASVLFRSQTSRLEGMFGKRATLLGSCFLFLLSNCLYFFAANATILIAIRFFSGACFAIVNTSIMSLGSRIVPQQRIGEGLAYLTTVVTAGMAVGPFAGLSLSSSYGYEAVFIFSVVMTFIGLLITCAIRIPDYIADEARSAGSYSIRRSFESGALPVSAILMLLSSAYAAVITFVTMYANESQLTVAGTYFFVVLASFSVLSRLATGRIYDRFGANAVIYPSIAAMTLGLFLLGRASSGLELLSAAALIGLSYGIAVPSIQTIAIQKSSTQRISAVTATVFTFLDIGMGVGAFVSGSVIHVIGYARFYLLFSPLVLSIAVFYHYIHGRKRPLTSYV
jgi:predicted MFS family arabinose efflux permease